MSRRSVRIRPFARRALGPVVLIAIAALVPSWARLTVHFAATFNLPSAPGGAMIAEVGVIATHAPPGEFQLVTDPTGGGHISVQDSGIGSNDAVLACAFDKGWAGGVLTASWDVAQIAPGGPLIFRFADDSDAGMIDVDCDGQGNIFVADQLAGPLPPGIEHELVLVLKDPLIGPATWLLQAMPKTAKAGAPGDGGGPPGWSAGGLLPKGLKLSSLRIIRPANTPAAQYTVDEIRVMSGLALIKF